MRSKFDNFYKKNINTKGMFLAINLDCLRYFKVTLITFVKSEEKTLLWTLMRAYVDYPSVYLISMLFFDLRILVNTEPMKLKGGGYI